MEARMADRHPEEGLRMAHEISPGGIMPMVDRKGWRMFFSNGVHQRRLMGLVVAALAAVLVSSCGGGGDTTSAGGEEQASKADLDAALKKSFRERAMRLGWWPLCRRPSTRGLAPWG